MAVFNAGSIEASLDLDVDPFQRGLTWARAEGQKFAREKWTAKIDADTTLAARGANNLRRSLERVEGTYRAKVEVDGVAEAAAQAAGLNQELDRLGRSRTSVDVDTRPADRSIARTRRGIAAMIAPLAILSTGAIPLGAAAVPAAGLASSLTLGAGAIGTIVLGAQGVGEALKAANAAGAEPTAENLAKAQASMAALTPEARAFVRELQTLAGPAAGLQRAAAEGLFPGINRGLDTVRAVIPEYRGLIFDLADVTGDRIGGTLQALDDPRWVQFSDFLHAEARPGIDDVATSLGNLAGAAAGWWQAFDPLNDDFSDWLVRSTAAMRDSAERLPDNPEFQAFIAYVREQGPEAAATLLSLGGAIADVVVAAAPLGGVVLDVLEGVGNAISFIAEQPFGPTLLTGAAALYTFNRALAITEGLMKRAGLATAGAGLSGVVGGLQAKATAGVSGIRGAASDVALLARTRALASGSAERELSGANEAAARLRGTLGTIAAAGAGLAGITLLATGAADALGITNTATLALAGSMVGPLGAAVGASVGLFLDYRNAAGLAADAAKAYQAATSNEFTNVTQQQTAAQQYQASQPSLGQGALAIAGGAVKGALTGSGGLWEGLTTGADDASAKLQAMTDDVLAAQARTADLELAAGTLAKQLGVVDTATSNTAITTEQMDAALLKAQPAMAALGISTADLQDAAAHGGLQTMLDRIAAWQERADSAGGRTRAFAQSVADLGNDALATADSATAMSTALEALLGPQLGLEQATDAWHQSLKALEKDLKAGAGFQGYTAAAIANRQATRDYTTDSMARLEALAKVSSTTERDMAVAVRATRREFIQSGIAAGFSRKQITARADALGLTPKLVKTVFQAAGIDAADLKARKYRAALQDVPHDVRTLVRQDGVPTTMAQVNELVKRYELTEKERRALVSLMDRASGPLQGINAWLDRIDGYTASASVVTHYSSTGSPPGSDRFRPGLATGGPVYGPGTPTSDSVPVNLSHGEHVMTAREVQAAGGHQAVADIRRAILEWGRPRPAGPRLSARQASVITSQGAGVDRIVDAIRASRSVNVAVSSRADLLAALQALDAELRNR